MKIVSMSGRGKAITEFKGLITLSFSDGSTCKKNLQGEIIAIEIETIPRLQNAICTHVHNEIREIKLLI